MKKFIKIVALAALLGTQGAEASWSPDTVRNMALAGMGLVGAGVSGFCYYNYLKRSVDNQIGLIIDRKFDESCKNQRIPAEKGRPAPVTYEQLGIVLSKGFAACVSTSIIPAAYKKFNSMNAWAVKYLLPLEYMQDNVRKVRKEKILGTVSSFFDRRFASLQRVYDGIPTPMPLAKDDPASSFRQLSDQLPIYFDNLHKQYLEKTKSLPERILILIDNPRVMGTPFVVGVPLHKLHIPTHHIRTQNNFEINTISWESMLKAFQKVYPNDSPRSLSLLDVTIDGDRSMREFRYKDNIACNSQETVAYLPIVDYQPAQGFGSGFVTSYEFSLLPK